MLIKYVVYLGIIYYSITVSYDTIEYAKCDGIPVSIINIHHDKLLIELVMTIFLEF